MLDHPWITKSYKIQQNAQLDREILSSLKEFNQKNLLQKEILFVMARISKENEIQKLKQAFKLIDKDNSGEIEYNCIPLIFERAGITPSSKEVDSLWNSLDFHQDGKINYSEFLAATISSATFCKEEKLWSVFQYFDRDDTGYITSDSVIEALRQSNLEVNDKGITELFKELKKSGDKLSFDEFKEIFFSNGHNRMLILNNNQISK